MSKLAEYNKIVHPELNGACAVCGIDPSKIKHLFQELINESIPQYNDKLSRQYLSVNIDSKKAHKNGYRLAIREQRQRAKKLMEKL